MESFTGIFQGFWQLSRNSHLKEHIWTAASKETDVIKSAVKVYESLCKRCGDNLTLFALILQILTHRISTS